MHRLLRRSKTWHLGQHCYLHLVIRLLIPLECSYYKKYIYLKKGGRERERLGEVNVGVGGFKK